MRETGMEEIIDIKDRWMGQNAAIALMVVIFCSLGWSIVHTPLPWWQELLCSFIVGCWMPGWFFDRMEDNEPAGGFGSNNIRYFAFALIAALAGYVSAHGLPVSHASAMTAIAACRAMWHHRTKTADILGVFSAVLLLGAMF